MNKLLMMAVLCAGCANAVLEEVPRTIVVPTVYRTCMLPNDCPAQPILSMLLVPSWETFYVPVEQRIDEVFAACIVGVDNTGRLYTAPEGTMRITHERDGATRMSYDPRHYDWVPAVPGVEYIGVTNISEGEIACSVTFGIYE